MIFVKRCSTRQKGYNKKKESCQWKTTHRDKDIFNTLTMIIIMIHFSYAIHTSSHVRQRKEERRRNACRISFLSFRYRTSQHIRSATGQAPCADGARRHGHGGTVVR